jgi:hypothetical protein
LPPELREGENMKEEMNTTKPARAKDLRNPLIIFGLVLLGGGIPLVAAYGLTSDPMRAWLLLVAIVALTFGMAGFFCYLVAYKPRHLYAPEEIPDKAIGKSLYSDSALAATLALSEAADKPDKKPEPLSNDALKVVVNGLTTAFCRYLFRAANKAMTLDEHIKTLGEEGGLSIVEKLGQDMNTFARGYFLSSYNFAGSLFELAYEQNKFTFRVPSEVLDLIEQRLYPETANSP